VKTIYIRLHKGKGFLSKLIKWQTRSEYSHASIQLDGGLCYESREGRGVRAFHASEDFTKGEQVDFFELTVDNNQYLDLIMFLREQLGKKYDYTMVARFVSRRQAARAESEKWFCSELVYASLMVAGVKLLSYDEPWRISPEHIHASPIIEPCSRPNLATRL